MKQFSRHRASKSTTLIALVVVVSAAVWAADPNDYFSPARRRRWQQEFPAADTNGDGILTQREALAWRDQLAARQAVPTPPTPKRPTPTHANVRYGPYFRNLLDVYLPVNSTSPTPVIINFHGGGWVAGDKASVGAAPALARNVAVVSANYRYTKGSPDAAPYPAPMEDGAQVVQFVRSRAKAWNIDPERVALTGVSAGAVTSMWIAYHDDMAEPKSNDLVAFLEKHLKLPATE